MHCPGTRSRRLHRPRNKEVFQVQEDRPPNRLLQPSPHGYPGRHPTEERLLHQSPRHASAGRTAASS